MPQTETLLVAATRLAELLEAENTALAAADVPRATALVAAKAEALAGLQAMLPLAAPANADSEQRHEAEQLNRRLQAAMTQNRLLLERALTVQNRIIGMIVRAMPRAIAASAPRYGAKGGIHEQHLRQPVAMSSRA